MWGGGHDALLIIVSPNTRNAGVHKMALECNISLWLDLYGVLLWTLCCENICAVAGDSRPAEQPAASLCDECISRNGIHMNNASLHAKLPFTDTTKNYLNVGQCGLYIHTFISNIQLHTFKEQQFNNYKRQEKLSKNTLLEISNFIREKQHKP